MENEPEVTLTAGRLRLALIPSVGGAISAFEWTSEGALRPIMRHCDRPLAKVGDTACFPLVPYVNRIRGGVFQFRGEEIRIAPNMAGDPSPLHGQGWLNPWTVELATEDRALLTYRHDAAEWPWDYEARQDFALDGDGLSVTLECRNLSPRAMPCGLGFHPYFPCGAATRIDTIVDHVWTVDDRVLPVAKLPATGRYALADRLVCGQGLDNGFDGWGGQATMTDPGWPYDLRLTSPDAHFFQLYSPRRGGIFVAEPVTHANTALNAPEAEWATLGIRILEPGESMSVTMRIEVIERSTAAG